MLKLTHTKNRSIKIIIVASVAMLASILALAFSSIGFGAENTKDETSLPFVALDSITPYQLESSGVHLTPIQDATRADVDNTTGAVGSDNGAVGSDNGAVKSFVDKTTAIASVKANYSLAIYDAALASCTVDYVNNPRIVDRPCWAVSVSPEHVVFHGLRPENDKKITPPKATFNIVFVDATTGDVLGSFAGAAPAVAP